MIPESICCVQTKIDYRCDPSVSRMFYTIIFLKSQFKIQQNNFKLAVRLSEDLLTIMNCILLIQYFDVMWSSTMPIIIHSKNIFFFVRRKETLLNKECFNSVGKLVFCWNHQINTAVWVTERCGPVQWCDILLSALHHICISGENYSVHWDHNVSWGGLAIVLLQSTR